MTNSPKILYISASEYPSSSANSVQVVKQSNAFTSLGYSVTIFSRANYKDNFISYVGEIEQKYGMSHNVNLALMKYRLVTGVLRSGLYPLWIAFSVFNKRPNIVYGRHALGLLSAGLFTRPKALIYECHGPPKPLEIIALRLMIMFKKLDRIVVISSALKNILNDRYQFLQQIDTIVAHDGCEAPSPLQETSPELRVGYVGSFYRGRGLDLIAKLATKLPFVQFHLVGGNEDQFTDITGMSLPENIICHGRIPPVDLYRYYKLFNVALAPYGNKIEVADGTNTVDYMSPLKIFEYMGYGKAIIASDLPVLREVLTDKVNALLVKPGDLGNWYKAIITMQDPAIRKTLTINSLKDATEKYTWEARANLILQKVDNE